MNPIPQYQPQTAYLHLLVDTNVTPPVVVSAGVHSDSTPTIAQHGLVWAKIGEVTRGSYGEAREAMLEYAMSVHGAWLRPLLNQPVG